MSAEENSRRVSTEDRARRLHALADPIRLAIVDLLDASDLSPDTISTAINVPGNLLAHHLKVLESAGLVARTQSQSDRRRTYVKLTRSSLDGLLPSPTPLAAPRVVFVCTHNSARSVMAESMWQAMSEVPTASAGTHPAARFNPRARAATRRSGLAFPVGTPRHLGEVLREDDVVISVCDAVNEDLGQMPNPRIHWSIPDPSPEGTDAAFSRALTEIRHRVAELAPHVHHRSPTNPRRRRT